MGKFRALYRKWRPATFEDVVGQAGITTALKNQILHDKVGHAYIFTGTRALVKRPAQKIFAKSSELSKPEWRRPLRDNAGMYGY